MNRVVYQANDSQDWFVDQKGGIHRGCGCRVYNHEFTCSRFYGYSMERSKNHQFWFKENNPEAYARIVAAWEPSIWFRVNFPEEYARIKGNQAVTYAAPHPFSQP